VATLSAHTTLKQKFINLKPQPHIQALSPGSGGMILDTGRSVLPPTGSHIVATLSAHATSTKQQKCLKMRLAPADLRTKLPAPGKIIPHSIKNLQLKKILQSMFLSARRKAKDYAK
jgi:hypothetical protein